MRLASMRCLAPLFALLLLAQGCGIKGPLYIPTAEQKMQAEERRQRREAAKQRDAGQAQAARPAPTTAAGKLDAPAAAATPEPEDEPLEDATSPMPDETFGPSSLPP